MSRTNFAQMFKAIVETSPTDYLTRWRMVLAGDRLTNSGSAISVIALSLRYESESAFSMAFRRVMGRSPRQYGCGGMVDRSYPAVDDERLLATESLLAEVHKLHEWQLRGTWARKVDMEQT